MTKNVRKVVKERDGFKCVNCKSGEFLTIDHIVPKSLGGSDDISNLQTLCRGCNIMKSNKPPTFRRLFNFFFGRKTIYEFKNEFNAQLSGVQGRFKKQIEEQIAGVNKRIDEELLQKAFELAELANKVKELETKHKSYIDRLVKRIHYLEAYLEIEWVEEDVSVREYRKIKKVKSQKINNKKQDETRHE